MNVPLGTRAPLQLEISHLLDSKTTKLSILNRL